MALLKILHFWALAAGLGFSLAGLVMMAMSKGAAPEAGAVVMKTRARLAQLSGAAIVVLWITGLWMWLTVYSGAMGQWLAFKLLCVLALTCVSAYMNFVIYRAARGGPRPVPARMAYLAKVAAGLAALIVVLAVLAFRG
ncbi:MULTISPECIES: hypothetical protein [unclassified Marinovum]